MRIAAADTVRRRLAIWRPAAVAADRHYSEVHVSMPKTTPTLNPSTLATATMTTRGRPLAIPAGLALALGLSTGASVRAQDDDERDTLLSEVPTTGAARPGPVIRIEGARAETAEAELPPGVTPVLMNVPDTVIADAPIEEGTITPDGIMNNPSGPWVVTWYKDLSMLGQGDNLVMAGHVDWWDVGPAIFQNVPAFQPGQLIYVTGDNGETYEYAVEWLDLFNVATELTPEVIQNDVVGPTGQESLTLITCGGAFDAATGEYLERWVVRANATARTSAAGENLPLA